MKVNYSEFNNITVNMNQKTLQRKTNLNKTYTKHMRLRSTSNDISMNLDAERIVEKMKNTGTSE